jgi:hypothetical protein
LIVWLLASLDSGTSSLWSRMTRQMISGTQRERECRGATLLERWVGWKLGVAGYGRGWLWSWYWGLDETNKAIEHMNDLLWIFESLNAFTNSFWAPPGHCLPYKAAESGQPLVPTPLGSIS